jgi:5-formyltetrahydrofolate cyclo-ligase
MDIKQQKQQLRSSIAERMAKLSQKDRDAESRSICRRIKENLPENIRTICAYYPMPTEVNIIPLLQEFLDEGKAIALPRSEGKAFLFRTITSLTDLPPGPYRIPEPGPDAPVLDLAQIDLALIPGIAFDPAGNRLGRGNGGYDQWIVKVREANPNVKLWGIAFDCQIVNIIPMESHDETIDAIITPRMMIAPKR